MSNKIFIIIFTICILVIQVLLYVGYVHNKKQAIIERNQNPFMMIPIDKR